MKVKMSEHLKRQTKAAYFWFKPLLIVLCSPFTIIAMSYPLGITLPAFSTHPFVLSVIAALWSFYIWREYKIVLMSALIRFVFIFAPNKYRKQINAEFALKPRKASQNTRIEKTVYTDNKHKIY